MFRGRLNVRSRVMAGMLAIVLLPMVWVWVAGVVWSGHVNRVQQRVVSVAEHGAEVLLKHPDPQSRLAFVSQQENVRVRWLVEDALRVDVNHEDPELPFHALLTPFWGPEGAPDPTRWDEQQGPLPQRVPVVAARTGTGLREQCVMEPPGYLLVCTAARHTPKGTVVASQSSIRLLRSLYTVRFQLLLLLGYTGLIAGGLALYLGQRLVRPIEELRDAVTSRTLGSVRTDPIEVQRTDEFGELAVAFNHLLEAISLRDRANTAFAADLAHELKNPLAAVRTATESLGSGRPVDEARAQRLARILGDSALRIETMIARFLELAEAEAGLMSQDREVVSIRELCENLVRQVTAQHPEVSFDVSGDVCMVQVATERMETVLRNLLTNAIAFSPMGGRTPQVGIRCHQDQLCTRIEVRDSGPGVNEEDIPRIFDRYFSKRAGGTGLGLALSQAIVRAHGGELQVHNLADSGACFVIELPPDLAANWNETPRPIEVTRP